METQSKKSKWMPYLLGFLFLAIIGTMCMDGKTDEEKAQEEIAKAQEDSLTACYLYAKELLVKNLKDPDSYDELEKEKYFLKKKTKNQKEYIQVSIRYKATNSFNANIQNKQCFNFDKNMIMIETFECE